MEGLVARPTSSRHPASTGIAALDALLPEGGLPRGQAIEWTGPRSCGKTALLRTTLEHLHGTGEPVAIVDSARTLYAPDWTSFEGGAPFWVIRPAEPGEAIWCADLLLRSGAFGAVALELYEASNGEASNGEARAISTGRGLSRSLVVRLQRLAEDAGAVLMVVGNLPLASVRLRFRSARVEPIEDGPFGPTLPSLRPVWVELGKGGSREIPILCPVPPQRSVQPSARDRKGPK